MVKTDVTDNNITNIVYNNSLWGETTGQVSLASPSPYLHLCLEKAADHHQDHYTKTIIYYISMGKLCSAIKKEKNTKIEHHLFSYRSGPLTFTSIKRTIYM